jgi:replicative DNA helicase
MIEIANLIIGDGYDDSVNCFDMLNTYNKLLSNLEEGVKQVDIDHIKEVAIETVKEIKQAIDSNNEGKTIGLPTFSKTIDEMSGGFINGEVSVIAGRPGEGKTAALLQSLINIANKSHRIGLISLEMSKTLLTKRMVSNLAKINGYKLRDGKLSEFEYNEVLKAVDKLMEKQVFITDDVYISMRKMRAIIRKFVLTHKCEIVFIDYLQLIESEEQGKREDQVNFAMMRNFQKIAREFNIPIVILCQLSRNDNKRPTIESLRGGGIEQAAGLVVILYDENYLKATGVMDVEMLAIVGKARHGRTGDVTILFNKEFQTIEEVASYAGTYKPPLTTADNEPLF